MINITRLFQNLYLPIPIAYKSHSNKSELALMKLKLPLLLLFALFFISCKKDDNTSKEVFIKGQIVNPSSKYVIISKNNIDLDTFHLNENNQFEGKLKNIKPGLYVFKHPPENQVIYLEPGDSTLVWLNTLAFDESINFSGKGAEKSNFLSNLYLLNEKDNDLILSYYKLDPSEFAQKTDSIRDSRKQELIDLEEKNEISQEFFNLANLSINYEFYDLRERYAFLIRKYNKQMIKRIPSNFHDYRSQVSFDNEDLEDYYVYLNFIDDFLRTKSIENCPTSSPSNSDCYSLNSYENLKYRISLVDSLITNEQIKNTFLDRLVSQGIVYSQKSDNLDSILSLLKQTDYTGDLKDELNTMAKNQLIFLPGNNLSERKYLTMNGDTVKYKNFTKRPSITYRWTSSNPSQHKKQHQIISDLRVKYPEVDFIGINLDKETSEDWKKAIFKNYYNTKYELKSLNISVDKNVINKYLNKLIFMDNKGTIVRGDLQINTPDLETKILEFISQQ